MAAPNIQSPRRFGLAAIITVVGVAIAGIVGWSLYNSHQASESSNGEPTVVGKEGVDPLESALADYFEDNGEYPDNADELTDLDRNEQLQYRVVSSGDGKSYIAGVLDYIGEYAAFTSESETAGYGESFSEALQNAGFTQEWAAEKGFVKQPVTSKTYGGITVTPEGVKKITSDLVHSEYVASVTKYPKVASADSWEKAVSDAGGDPSKIVVPKDLEDGTAQDVVSSDKSFTARLLHEDDAWTAKVSWAPKTSTGYVLEELMEAIDAPGLVDESGSLGTFLCATATGPQEMAEVTACQLYDGSGVAWATTGTYGEGASIMDAIGMSGAGKVWADENDVLLPDYADMF